MSPELWLNNALVPALKLLPPHMDSPAARAMCVTICLQESGLAYRRQAGGGPARGYAQMELGGVRGVLVHPASRPFIQSALSALDYDHECGPDMCYEAIEHNDILACCFARLLLWTLPDKLPDRIAPGSGWGQYVAAWRPGKPRPESWNTHFADAWALAAVA